MNTKFEPNNLKVKKNGSNENIYTNRLKSGVDLKKLVSEFKYFTPQFYLKKKNNIKIFHSIDTNLKLFNKKYEELKNILELNKTYLNLPSTNIKLNFDTDKNIIYKNLDFQKSSDLTYLISNKKIFKNIQEYKTSRNIYDSIKSNIFIKILNDNLKKKDVSIFIHLYKTMLKYSTSILKYNYSTGLLGYSPIFNLNEPDETNLNNNNNSKKYKLMNSKVIFNTSSKNNTNSNQNESNKNNTNSNLNEKKKKIDELLIHYTDMYNSYNYNKIISKKKKEIDNLCINYHSISSKLSKKSYTNIFDLLNLLLDQEYYLINFILNLNDIELYKKTLRQDNTIRKYIKRNILNFSSYMDEYKVKAPKIGEIDMFSIQDYDINTFFKTTNT
tara:strand:- start:7965 stop:9119 length:1155 start_codon:yes stop_codon:yes gene_type:complete